MSNRKKDKDKLKIYREHLEESVKERIAELKIADARLQREIARRKRAEEALRETEERYRRILETAAEGIWFIDSNNKTVFVNQKMAEMLGYNADEMTGQPLFTFMDEEGRAIAEANLERRRQGIKEQHDFRFRRKDGTDLWAIVSATPILDEKGQYAGALGLITDINDRKRMEKMLKESEEKYRALMNYASDPILLADDEGNLLEVNKKAEELFGYTREELLRMNISQIHPEKELGRTIAAFKEMLQRGSGSLKDVLVLRKNGKMIPVDITGSVINYAGKRVNQGIFRDISERKHAEEEMKKLNDELQGHIIQLETTNKELEAFSYSASHDLRAPLKAIGSFLSVLLRDYTDKLDDKGKRYLNTIRSYIQKMEQLIHDLLSLSRIGRQQIVPADVEMGELAKAVFEELKASNPERGLQFNINVLPPARGDRIMIHQVFVNLLSNAIKFTRPRGTAVIEVGGWSEEKETTYYIKDNGVGFDMQYANRLFNAFQRLHSAAEFEGTGVGLAIVQRIIHRHGGRVWAEGKVNEGATFYFTLPK